MSGSSAHHGSQAPLSEHWHIVYDKFMKKWRAAIPKRALAEAYPTIHNKAPGELQEAFDDLWEGVCKFYKDEMAAIFESGNIFALSDELAKLKEAALNEDSGGEALQLEPPSVSPDDEMRTLTVDIKAANRDQLAKIVGELKARNDALEEDLLRLDARAKTLVPRVEDKLRAFEQLQADCGPMIAGQQKGQQGQQWGGGEEEDLQ